MSLTRAMNYYGFNDSSAYIIALSVSGSDVSLPMLNISFRNLMLLDASFNNLEHIDDIGNETFPSLKSFNLSHNAIMNVQSHLFSHLKEIEILDLSHNCFVKFHPGHTITRHEYLKKLYLQNNLIHTIAFDFTLVSLLSLEFLDLSNNFLGSFANYGTQISYLEITNNSLKDVVINHAKQMVLNAQHNNLTNFLAPMGSFRKLNISYNDFTFLSNVQIAEAVVLDLSNNNFGAWAEESRESREYYDDGDWSDWDSSVSTSKAEKPAAIKTKHLNLAHNNISHIHELRHFKHCEELNLEANSLKNIDPEDFRILFPMLKKVNLLNNPLTSVDENELMFFNSTRLLSLHFDYGTTTTPKPVTLLPPLPPFFPLLSTSSKIIETTTSIPSTTPQTESSTQTKSTTTSTETHHVESTTVESVDEKSSSHVWIFAIVFAAIALSSVAFLNYRKRLQKDSIGSRSYNEAVNFL